MRVLYCHDNMYVRDAAGGVFSQGQFAAAFWDPLCAVFDSVHVLGRAGSGVPDDRFNRSDQGRVTFDLVPNINTFKGMVIDRPRAARVIDSQIKQSDAVILRSMGEITWLAFCSARRHGKPIAVEMAGCPWDNAWYHGSLKGRVMAPIRYWRARGAVRAASHVLYVTDRFLQARYPASTGAVTEAISNVRLPDHADEPSILALRQKRDPNGHAPLARIGMIGALNHRLKGHDVAFKALAQLRDRWPNITLHCLGPGDAGSLQVLARQLGIAPQVRFDGMRPSGDPVMAWLDDCDLYLQPSRHEGLPRSLIEAMSRALPCIGSDAGGIPELLPPDAVIARGDVAQLAAGMDRFLSSRDLRLQNGQANIVSARRFASSLLASRRRVFWSDFARHARGTMPAQLNEPTVSS